MLLEGLKYEEFQSFLFMKKYFFTFCFLGVISALSSQESRTENNGNLILEDIPAIPNSIKEDLSKFQNVRSAAFRGFNNQNEGLFRHFLLL